MLLSPKYVQTLTGSTTWEGGKKKKNKLLHHQHHKNLESGFGVSEYNTVLNIIDVMLQQSK